MSFQCPNCGRPLKVIPLSASAPSVEEGGWEAKEMTAYSMAFGGGQLAKAVEYVKETPHWLANIKSNVVVPLLQAACFGGVVFILIGGLNWLFGPWKLVIGDKTFSVWRLAVAAGIFAFAATFVPLVLYHLGLLKSKERVYTESEDEEGEGEGQHQTLEITIVEPKPGGGRMRFLSLEDIDEEVFTRWAQAVANGASLSGPRWWGAGRPFTQATYTVLMDKMESLDYVRNYGGSKGRRLTPSGERMLAKLGRK